MKRENPFDERCYALLNQIPAGKVTTYREIANALNSKAWRAVGSTMAKNKNLIKVPCHRVVRKDGDLSGYRWGVERKSELLDREEASNKK